MASLNCALEISGLRKSYGGRSVISGIGFSVPAGACFGILGPNGAGKTTTLRCCLGLTPPDEGKILLGGHSIPDGACAARARVGVVPQFDNLDPDFTVNENLLVYSRYFGLKKAEMRQRIPGLLDFAGLTDKENARVEALSGGMKRRLTLARALVNDPDILFLDEPTTGLDPQARHLIWDRLKQLVAQGKTLILTTHFMEEAERLCERLIVLDHGQIVAEGNPHELIASQIEPNVIEIFGENAVAWAKARRALCQRLEIAGETAYFYCKDTAPVREALDKERALHSLHRAANLEDVFIKLTGRELRD
ncbi:MAG: ATP-binding cassette domain-containing protein [Candidatus Accumulibacter sp.]|jgi:lipooligosaccharide transport system ATP-binding protein|nr:ATP-binding cassette domain-containing protein [Accumulibacter sp.]